MIEQLLMADRLLTVDQVQQARDLYTQVVGLDPRNAIAVVGLARCALADGDDRAAYELAADALRIDPENDMARRMEARLAEVLAERGEPVERAGSGPPPAPGRAPTAEPLAPGAAAEPGTPGVADVAGPGGTTTAPTSTESAARRSILERLLGR